MAPCLCRNPPRSATPNSPSKSETPAPSKAKLQDASLQDAPPPDAPLLDAPPPDALVPATPAETRYNKEDL